MLLAGCGKSHSTEQEAPHKPHSVTLSWTASTSKVVGYNVYRSYPPGAPFVKLTPEPVAGDRYTDTSAESGRTYTYYVTAVDSNKKESRPSDPVFATVPNP
jgi:fibronectin type 3 domain-containing protein